MTGEVTMTALCVRVLWCTLSSWSLAACASGAEEPRRDPVAEERAPPETGPADRKVRAPVELRLSAEGGRDALTLSLTARATADIPRAVARFTLPEGVTLASGALEQELGALGSGAAATVSVVVRARGDRPTTIFAGVDCHLSRGVKLYGVTRLELPVPDAAPPLPERVLLRDGVRASPARPRD